MIIVNHRKKAFQLWINTFECDNIMISDLFLRLAIIQITKFLIKLMYNINTVLIKKSY